MSATRKLAAILAADVVGYSRLTGADEEGTLARLKTLRHELIDPTIAVHRGRTVKTTGDGILIEFASVVDALRCAIEVQHRMGTCNVDLSADKRIEFRIGINLGDVVVEGDDLLGDGVNVAARLEGIAEPGGICISEDAYRHSRDKVDTTFVDMGEQHLKNIARPVRAYRLRLSNAAVTVPPTLALPDKPSIAVLPFQNMSGDPEQEYFADGVVDEIITALSRFKNLFVIARNSTFACKSRAVDVKQIGRELGVRYVLEGSVRKAGNRVRITGRLVDTTTGAHLWADRFDGELDDIFGLQDQVTASVVGAIGPRLEKAEIERAKRKPTESLDAYGYYMRARASPEGISRQANTEALRLFNRAIELDPDFSSAYGYTAQCYVTRQARGWMTNPADEIGEAERLARRGVVLGKDDAVALAGCGLVLAHAVRDLDAGAAFIERALLLNPNLAMAWVIGGYVKLWQSEPETALERFARAMRLSPLDPAMPQWRFARAHAYFFLGRYDEASSWAAMDLQEAPDMHFGLRITAASNALAGRLEQAQRAVTRLQQLNPTLRVSTLREVLGPYRRPEDLAKYEDGLRKAGLPEE